MRPPVVSNINPARSLVLTHEEHALLGELVEIMGLIENILIESVEPFDPAASIRLSGMPAGPQARLWMESINGRVTDPTVSALIPAARLELEQVAEDRNAFIHALYENDYVDGYVEPGYQTTSATRSKTGTSRPTADLQRIRDRAATLSVMVDAIGKAVI